MTIAELNQLNVLKKAIQYQEQKIESMRDSLGLKSPALTDMPKAPGAKDKIGEVVPTIVDETVEMEKQLKELTEKKDALEDWMKEQPVNINLICQLRFVDGLSWQKVADFMDPGNGKVSADTVRKALTNHLGKQAGYDG